MDSASDERIVNNDVRHQYRVLVSRRRRVHVGQGAVRGPQIDADDKSR